MKPADAFAERLADAQGINGDDRATFLRFVASVFEAGRIEGNAAGRREQLNGLKVLTDLPGYVEYASVAWALLEAIPNAEFVASIIRSMGDGPSELREELAAIRANVLRMIDDGVHPDTIGAQLRPAVSGSHLDLKSRS